MEERSSLGALRGKDDYDDYDDYDDFDDYDDCDVDFDWEAEEEEEQEEERGRCWRSYSGEWKSPHPRSQVDEKTSCIFSNRTPDNLVSVLKG